MQAALLAFAAIAGSIFLADLWAHRRADKPISLGNAAGWSLAYIFGAMAFAGFLFADQGQNASSLFLAGFVMEKALSVDNLMVFVAIFAYFRIPDEYQHRILHYGIIGAVVFRLIFVAIGAGALEAWGAPVALLFGVVVLWSAWKMWGGGAEQEDVDFSAQWYARWAVRILPFVNAMPKGRFLVWRFKQGTDTLARHGTPMLMALIAIELSDVMFSFDSVPAVIAVTQEPVLVYSAMIFAILGLRQLYFVLTALLRYLTRLGGAIIAVLAFIGAKLVVEAVQKLLPLAGIDGPDFLEIGPVTSLFVVLGLLATGVIASILWPETEKASANAPHTS